MKSTPITKESKRKLVRIFNYIIALATISLGLHYNGYSQNDDYYYDETNSLSGPRLGFTYITGKTAEVLNEKYNASPVITQFGWQVEWRFFTVNKGPTGVVEFVPLLGGLEQGLFLPSISTPIGLRTYSGFEFGVGPNVSVSGFSIAFAVGYTFRTGELNWPVNISLVPSKEGFRYSLLFGFNMTRD